jgi:acetyl-CoA carboxylase biotin carboxyl carrier protein
MPPTKKAAPKSAPNDPDLELIASLAEILNDTGLSEIELDRKGTKFRVAKQLTAMATVTSAAQAPVVHAHAAPAHEATAAAKAGGDHPGTVKSPMVGTVYLQPDENSPAFVKIGDAVTEGQTLLLIEAMKTFNPVTAPRAGKVTQILVKNTQPVEFGEPLVIIE